MPRMAWRMLVLAVLVFASGLTLAVAWGQLAGPTTPALAQADTQQVTVTDVVDGDTIDVSAQVEGTNRIRLIGVDTPEVFGGEEPCGPESSDFTTEQLEGQDVTLEFDEDRVDPYDRALAYVWVPDLDGELFNETLVRRGLARVSTSNPTSGTMIASWPPKGRPRPRASGCGRPIRAPPPQPPRPKQPHLNPRRRSPPYRSPPRRNRPRQSPSLNLRLRHRLHYPRPKGPCWTPEAPRTALSR
jgi:endonuclease YncB( thermonuclease family)